MSHDNRYKTVYPYEIRQGYSSDGHYVLMLAEPKQVRVVPMLIGPAEAQALMLAQERQPTRRPMTHRLMMTMMEEYGLTLNQVAIERFDEGIFYANLYVSDGFNERCIDCRASDAVTLALLAERPILVAEGVLEEAAVPMEAIDGGAREPAEMKTEELERLLERYEEEENYEKAAEVLKEIERRRNEKGKKSI
ncbi:MAG: hypothetical protein AUK63_293 [bacterium P3]|nr:MAG: hypothetical protein AUK63_293 [bacterium P3]KWW42746.1 MAG: hypothetical protein F083_150 [bacterium F083]